MSVLRNSQGSRHSIQNILNCLLTADMAHTHFRALHVKCFPILWLPFIDQCVHTHTHPEPFRLAYANAYFLGYSTETKRHSERDRVRYGGVIFNILYFNLVFDCANIYAICVWFFQFLYIFSFSLQSFACLWHVLDNNARKLFPKEKRHTFFRAHSSQTISLENCMGSSFPFDENWNEAFSTLCRTYYTRG